MLLRFSAILLFLASVLRANTKTQEWIDPAPRELPASAAAFIDVTSGKLVPGQLGSLIEALGAQPDPKAYCIVHVVRWKNAAEATPDAQTWYVYNSTHDSDDDISIKKRVYGVKKITLIYIHLNRPADLNYQTGYALAAKSKTAAYINHLTGLIGLFNHTPALAREASALTANIWNYHDFTVPYTPSDLTFTPDFQLNGTPINGLTAETFDNEGLYHIDFSVGVPIRKISGVQYFAAGGTLTPVQVSHADILAFFDYYFLPVDIKGPGFSPFPHLVAGVKIGSQPLKTAVVGLGYGPAIANFYFGLLLTTAPAGNQTRPGFGFGLNLGVAAITDALKNK